MMLNNKYIKVIKLPIEIRRFGDFGGVFKNERGERKSQQS